MLFEIRCDYTMLWEMCIFFAIFSFAGWISESLICSIDNKQLINRGFLKGPFIPVYGFGGLIVAYILAPLKGNMLLLYITGVICTSILEYFTGWLMETIFKVKLWDYSEHKFNIKGRVWIVSSLFFGLLSIFAVYVIYPPVYRFFQRIDPKNFPILGIIILIYFIIDATTSAMAMVNIRKKLDELSEAFNEAMGEYKDEVSEKMDYRVDWLNTHRNMLKEKYNGQSEEFKQKISNLEQKVKNALDTNWMDRHLLKAYPKMSKTKYNQQIKHLREALKNRNKNKDNK